MIFDRPSDPTRLRPDFNGIAWLLLAMLIGLGPSNPTAQAQTTEQDPSLTTELDDPAAVEDEVDGPDESTTQTGELESDGVPIFYRDLGGPGEPVVLIHGLTSSLEINWIRVGIPQALRAAGYRVIGFDLRGHGRSGKPREPDAYGFTMVKDVIRLMDHLQVDRAHLVGYSLGGQITLQVMATHPERVRSAVLGGIGLIEVEQLSIFDDLADSLEQGRGFAPLFQALTPEPFEPPNPIQMRIIDLSLSAFNDVRALAAICRSARELIPNHQLLSASGIPTLGLVGQFDPLIQTIPNLGALLSQYQFQRIDLATHADAFAKAQFREALLKFLESQTEDVESGREPAGVGHQRDDGAEPNADAFKPPTIESATGVVDELEADATTAGSFPEGPGANR